MGVITNYEIDIAKYLCNQFETVEFLENFRKGTARNKIFDTRTILEHFRKGKETKQQGDKS